MGFFDALVNPGKAAKKARKAGERANAAETKRLEAQELEVENSFFTQAMANDASLDNPFDFFVDEDEEDELLRGKISETDEGLFL